jgi:sulfur carrier protein
VEVIVNGRRCELHAAATVRTAVEAAGAGSDVRGVAVAFDGAVVPRRAWDETPLESGSRVEVLRATAGG